MRFIYVLTSAKLICNKPKKNELQPKKIKSYFEKVFKKPIPKGCKEYHFKESFGELTVIAINDKSAMAKKKRWIENNKKI